MSLDNTLVVATLLSDLVAGDGHVVVGANSPLPMAGALLARSRGGPGLVSVLGSRKYNPFTEGGRELFDCTAQGRMDAFFLGGGQIDGQANINLVGIGDYPASKLRFPGSFGSAYLYHLVPKVILYRDEHSCRVLVDKVDFVSAPGTAPDGVFSRGGPAALVTRMAHLAFDTERRRFRLISVHPGHSVEEVLDNTGFDLDVDAETPVTRLPTDTERTLLLGTIRDDVAEIYPRFAGTELSAA